ncbi:S8 family serine peptidase [uncultured Roseibium sp.]|uniref:S8 family serine peptidase n=1 Tax=uncultured Roseibium sp. TaxID=1936171 RepID=UPI002636AC65|nr:S8 family serine peptidase [uncultured Roseibium sp.]
MKKLFFAFVAMPFFLPLTDAFRQESASFLFLQSAYADDDDSDSDSDGGDSDSDDSDDDDDNDDDDRNDSQGQRGGQSSLGGRNSGSASGLSPLRRLFGGQNRQRQEQTSPRRVVPTAPLPQFASSEIIVFNISPQDLQNLLDNGFGILEERSVSGGTVRSHRLSPPSNTSLEDARDAVRALPSGGNADFNHFYRLDRGDNTCTGQHCAAFTLIDWPGQVAELANKCETGIRLGMVDTGLNENHSTFSGAKIKVLRLADQERPASKASHGTAVAAILIGQPDTRTPGLLPDSELIAVDAFYRSGRDERADAFTLVEALYRLAEEQVSVINLSLSGPENRVLALAVDDIKENRGIALISAAGNNGPSADPAYPAAFPGVLAVTAVDKNKRIYRRANRGSYVDLAAPGVNVWSAASVKGAKWRTGTSFAVPFVSAAAAIVRQNNPDLSVDDVFELLKSNAEDLGEPGHDPIFGSGLLSVSALCGR